MKKNTITKCRTVTAVKAEDFDREFDRVSKELGSAELRWDTAPMCVHFITTETEYIPETLREEYELRGEKFYCKDCPFMEKPTDGRKRSGGCKYDIQPNAADYTPACEEFYHKHAAGEIKQKRGN